MKQKLTKFIFIILSCIIAASFIYYYFLIDDTEKEKSIHIAVVGPLSGTNGERGKSWLKGINLHLNAINENGGIHGKKIVLDIFDDRNEKLIAKRRAFEVVEQNKAVAVIAHDDPQCTIRGQKVYRQFKIPAITLSPGDIPPTKEENWCYRIFNDSQTRARYMACYIRNIMKKSSISIIHSNKDYGLTFLKHFKKFSKEKNLNITNTWSFNP